MLDMYMRFAPLFNDINYINNGIFMSIEATPLGLTSTPYRVTSSRKGQFSRACCGGRTASQPALRTQTHLQKWSKNRRLGNPGRSEEALMMKPKSRPYEPNASEGLDLLCDLDPT